MQTVKNPDEVSDDRGDYLAPAASRHFKLVLKLMLLFGVALTVSVAIAAIIDVILPR